MSVETDSKLLHDHLAMIHRLNTAMVEALLEVAKETDTDPAELAQLLGMGGGGFHSLFQPLFMRHQEEQQRRFMEAQRSTQTPAVED